MGAITSKWAGSGAGSTSRGLHEKLKRIQHRDHFVLSSSSAKAINFTQSGISIPGDVLVLQLAKFLSLEDIANVLATSKAMMTLMNGASSSAEQQYHFSHTNALWEDIYNRTIWSTTSSVSSSSSSISFPSYVASSLCAPLPCTSLLNPTKPSRRPSLLPSRTSSSSSPSSITQNQCDSLDECCWYAKWLKRVGSQKEAAFRFRRYEDQQRCILNELQRREKQQV